MVRLSILTLVSSLAAALALPQDFCTTVCRPVKPECPEGEVATGSEDCWGCCTPIFIHPIANETTATATTPEPTERVCTLQCRLEKPECPAGEAPTGSEGCWGCCQPIKTEEKRQDICTLECRPVKPECPAGEAPTGQEGCWGCCQPIKAEEKRQDVCTTECRPVKPECPVGEAPTGQESCWGCCQPIFTPVAQPIPEPAPTATEEKRDDDFCIDVCQVPKPVCPEGEAPTGNEDCWGCCKPIA